MSTRIKHLSIGVNDPKHAAEILAEMTAGNVKPFLPVSGGYVCLWPDWEGSFIEFYPKGTEVVPTEKGASFRIGRTKDYTSAHINLESDLSSEELKKIVVKHGLTYYFRPENGGPLHEVWIENELLFEIVTKDLRTL